MPAPEVESTSSVPTRVLHIASGDLWAGAEVQVYELVSQLHRSGVKCAVVLLNEGQLAARLRAAEISVTVIPESATSIWSSARKLSVIIRQFQPDVVHTHRFKENILGSILSRLSGVPSTRTIHGAPEALSKSLKSRALQSLDDWVGRRLQRCVVAVSNELKKKLVPVFGTDHIKVIHNGIDANRARELALGTTTGHANKKRIGFVGRLTQVKRVDVFLRIAALAQSQLDTSLEAVVIGDGPLRPELEKLAKELGVNCEFAGFQSNCLPDIASLDALLLTSDHEGLPIVALEALSIGTPLLVHAVGGLPELIQSEAQGYLVRSQRPEDYMPPLKTLLSRQRTEQQRPSLLPPDFSIHRTAIAYAELYLSISTNSRGG